MVLSRYRRPWRSLVLVLAGIVAGAALVAPGVSGLTERSVSPAAVQTRVASCQGLNFHPITSTTDWGYLGPLLYRADDGEVNDRDGFFVCDPGLPNKAVVTKVRFTVADASPSSQVRYCALYRTGLVASVANDPSQLVADAGDTSMPGTSAPVRLTTTTISHGTIDNASWGYYLQCQINFEPGTHSGAVGIYGASVTYRISSANG